jgi:predicted Zn-dependent protease with MMP-like domain
MVHLSDEDFEQLVGEAVAAIPARFADHLSNVSFMVAPAPTSQQLIAGHADHAGETLLGLYEGIPLPRRDNGYNFVLPDIITIFQQPHEAIAADLQHLRQQVRQTVWHEVAHYFGLGHDQIHELES